ncbi:S-layer homology domain-containing protein [Ferviditalea candida]|uniref:S-layer homology domain-containing protein n=1 Tax=Ferviditalea candida TaxID=3108399 RepID=A0ABU5ZNY0_9BACL|nr:S-layer homology domain-containing protein [Paenibacillaceae bacterium T2]
MKKIISTLLLAVLLLVSFNGSVLANTAHITFTDISSHWAEASIKKSVELGFINGYGDGTFRPENPITRAEFTTALVGAMKLPISKKSSVFVDDNNWAEPYIETAIENNIILTDEYDNLKFEPSKNITRQEIAVMAVRALDKAKEAEDQGYWKKIFSKLTDLTQVDEKFRGYIKIANDLGIVNGYLDGSFGPKKTATRAEAVVMVLNTLDKLPETDQTGQADQTEQQDQGNVQKDRLGRVIRTTDLPSNYKDYPYILATIPNEMYEMKYPYSNPDVTKRRVSSKLYSTEPQFTDENVDIWMERIEKYYDLVLNVDYRTIDENWESEAFEYINKGVNEDALRRKLKDYREWVQQNQIVVEGSLKPEPTMIYDAGFGGFFVRSQFDFKITSFKENENLLYDDLINYQKLKKDVEYKGYTDIELSTNHSGGNWGSTLRISNTASLFKNNIMN